MKIQSSILRKSENLQSTMKTFWANETLGTKLLEKNVLKKFIDEVDLIENRYQVKLPYKKNHETLEDNFKLWKQRLKNLTCKFEYDKNLLAAYNVFKEQKTDNVIEKPPSDQNLGKTHFLLH